MMTSRAEYRLILRQDNADIRLTKYGYRVGLISKERMNRLTRKIQLIDEEIERVKSVNIGTGSEVQKVLTDNGSTELTTGATLAELIPGKQEALIYQQAKHLIFLKPVQLNEV